MRDFEEFETSPLFKDFKEYPPYREFANLLVSPRTLSRNEAWKTDLEILKRLVTETHPDPFHSVERSDWLGDLQILSSNIKILSDLEIIKKMMKSVAAIGDGHTALYPPISGEIAWHMVPIWPIWMSDGWYVLAADQSFGDLVGAKILAVNDMDFDDIARAVSQLIATDNSMTYRWLDTTALQFAESYTDRPVQVGDTNNFTFEFPDGRQRTVSLPVGLIDRDPTSIVPPSHWSTLEVPASVTNVNASPFFHTLMPDTQIAYTRIDAINDNENESFSEYGAILTQFLKTNNASHVIIDLRNNNGGNGDLRWGFLRHLAQLGSLQPKNKVYVLIGPRTYSASIMFINSLQSLFDVTFVGMPTGGRPVGYSSETPFTLPNSGLSGSISNRFHVDAVSANDERPWIAPDIVVWPTGEDLRNGRDPVLDAAISHIKNSPK